jgi:hypothetical protein
VFFEWWQVSWMPWLPKGAENLYSTGQSDDRQAAWRGPR